MRRQAAASTFFRGASCSPERLAIGEQRFIKSFKYKRRKQRTITNISRQRQQQQQQQQQCTISQGDNCSQEMPGKFESCDHRRRHRLLPVQPKSTVNVRYGRRRMSSWIFFMLGLAVMLAGTTLLMARLASAHCPFKCQCDDQLLSANCTNVPSITIVPITLNPLLKQLTLSHLPMFELSNSLSVYRQLEYLNLNSNQLKQIRYENFNSKQAPNSLLLATTAAAAASHQQAATNHQSFKPSNSRHELNANNQQLAKQLRLSIDKTINHHHSHHQSSNQQQHQQRQPPPPPPPHHNSQQQHQSNGGGGGKASSNGNLDEADEIGFHLRQLDLSDNKIEQLGNNLLAAEDYYDPAEELGVAEGELAGGQLRPPPAQRRLKSADLERQAPFLTLTRLEVLNLRGNRLSKLHQHVFLGLIQLKVLDLSQNQLDYVDKHALVGLIELERLDLSSNRLAHHLPQLGMAACRAPLNQLDYLNLSDQIGSGGGGGGGQEILLPNQVFICAPNLRQLRLSSMRLRYIQVNAFDNLHRLESLTLSHNLIEQVPLDSLQSASSNLSESLRELDLSDTQIEFVQANSLAQLRGLEKLSMNSMQKLVSFDMAAFISSKPSTDSSSSTSATVDQLIRDDGSFSRAVKTLLPGHLFNRISEQQQQQAAAPDRWLINDSGAATQATAVNQKHHQQQQQQLAQVSWLTNERLQELQLRHNRRLQLVDSSLGAESRIKFRRLRLLDLRGASELRELPLDRMIDLTGLADEWPPALRVDLSFASNLNCSSCQMSWLIGAASTSSNNINKQHNHDDTHQRHELPGWPLGPSSAMTAPGSSIRAGRVQLVAPDSIGCSSPMSLTLVQLLELETSFSPLFGHCQPPLPNRLPDTRTQEFDRLPPSQLDLLAGGGAALATQAPAWAPADGNGGGGSGGADRAPQIASATMVILPVCIFVILIGGKLIITLISMRRAALKLHSAPNFATSLLHSPGSSSATNSNINSNNNNSNSTSNDDDLTASPADCSASSILSTNVLSSSGGGGGGGPLLQRANPKQQQQQPGQMCFGEQQALVFHRFANFGRQQTEQLERPTGQQQQQQQPRRQLWLETTTEQNHHHHRRRLQQQQRQRQQQRPERLRGNLFSRIAGRLRGRLTAAANSDNNYSSNICRNSALDGDFDYDDAPGSGAWRRAGRQMPPQPPLLANSIVQRQQVPRTHIIENVVYGGDKILACNGFGGGGGGDSGTNQPAGWPYSLQASGGGTAHKQQQQRDTIKPPLVPVNQPLNLAARSKSGLEAGDSFIRGPAPPSSDAAGRPQQAAAAAAAAASAAGTFFVYANCYQELAGAYGYGYACGGGGAPATAKAAPDDYGGRSWSPGSVSPLGRPQQQQQLKSAKAVQPETCLGSNSNTARWLDEVGASSLASILAQQPAASYNSSGGGGGSSVATAALLPHELAGAAASGRARMHLAATAAAASYGPPPHEPQVGRTSSPFCNDNSSSGGGGDCGGQLADGHIYVTLDRPIKQRNGRDEYGAPSGQRPQASRDAMGSKGSGGGGGPCIRGIELRDGSDKTTTNGLIRMATAPTAAAAAAASDADRSKMPEQALKRNVGQFKLNNRSSQPDAASCGAADGSGGGAGTGTGTGLSQRLASDGQQLAAGQPSQAEKYARFEVVPSDNVTSHTEFDGLKRPAVVGKSASARLESKRRQQQLFMDELNGRAAFSSNGSAGQTAEEEKQQLAVGAAASRLMDAPPVDVTSQQITSKYDANHDVGGRPKPQRRRPRRWRQRPSWHGGGGRPTSPTSAAAAAAATDALVSGGESESESSSSCSLSLQAAGLACDNDYVINGLNTTTGGAGAGQNLGALKTRNQTKQRPAVATAGGGAAAAAAASSTIADSSSRAGRQMGVVCASIDEQQSPRTANGSAGSLAAGAHSQDGDTAAATAANRARTTKRNSTVVETVVAAIENENPIMIGQQAVAVGAPAAWLGGGGGGGSGASLAPSGSVAGAATVSWGQRGAAGWTGHNSGTSGEATKIEGLRDYLAAGERHKSGPCNSAAAAAVVAASQQSPAQTNRRAQRRPQSGEDVAPAGDKTIDTKRATGHEIYSNQFYYCKPATLSRPAPPQ